MTGDIQRPANFFKNIFLQNHWPDQRIRAYHQMTDQIVMLTYSAPVGFGDEGDLPKTNGKMDEPHPQTPEKKRTSS